MKELFHNEDRFGLKCLLLLKNVEIYVMVARMADCYIMLLIKFI